MLRAALYDLDGLMVDSEPLHGQASELALNRYGHTHAGIPEAVRQGFYGKRVVDVAGEIVAVLGLPVTAARWAEERQRIFLELVERGIELMPGMIESLDFFDRRGMRKAVVSSGERRYVRRILQLTGLGIGSTGWSPAMMSPAASPTPSATCWPPRGWKWTRPSAWCWRMPRPGCLPPTGPECG